MSRPAPTPFARLRQVTCLALIALFLYPPSLEARSSRKRTSASPKGPTSMQFQEIHDAARIKLIAEGAILLDAFTGETLYEKNSGERLYPASSTKMLTALLVIEAGHLDQEVEIALEDTQVEPTSIGFKTGEHYTRRQLLYALLLKSANDVAHALARDNAGSVEAFAAKMTYRAHQLGATSSQFRNPHGLHDKEHYSTPHDMALIARTAMQQPMFRQLVGTGEYDWESPRGTTHLRNSNKLLVTFEGCTGGKTGYTNAARHVLVCAASREHREVISVVMRSDKAGKWTDTSQLLSYGLLQPAPVPVLPELVETASQGVTSAVRNPTSTPHP